MSADTAAAARLAHDVLARVARFLDQLPSEQLAAFARGEASLALVPARPAEGRAARPADGHDPTIMAAGPPSAAAGPVARTASPAATAAGPAAGRMPGRAVGAPPAADDVRARLATMGDRASAAAYLDGLGLTTAQLRTLARQLRLAVASSATKAAVRDTIVQWTVGRRVDAAVLSRPGRLG